MRGTRRPGLGVLGAWIAGLAILGPGSATAQGLANYDYENLGFRGLGLEVGWIEPSRVEPTPVLGARLDLGYLGPGLRILPVVSYWSSRLVEGEVTELEGRLAELVVRETDAEGSPPSVDLGVIDRSDLVVGLEAQVVWAAPWGTLTYLGAGTSVHMQNGTGEAIAGTFVEDLLDSVAAGVGVHAGIEYPVHPRLRVYGIGKLELLENLRYFDGRVGMQFMLAPAAPGEGGP